MIHSRPKKSLAIVAREAHSRVVPTNRKEITMNLHEAEEMEFGRDGGLWDADPDVCCAAFQLGACPHTEGGDYEDWDDDDVTLEDRAAPEPFTTNFSEEPF